MNKNKVDETKYGLQLTLLILTVTTPHHHPHRSPELKAFVFSAAPSIKLKSIVDLKWDKSLYSPARTHTLAHMLATQGVETHNLLLKSLRIKSL